MPTGYEHFGSGRSPDGSWRGRRTCPQDDTSCAEDNAAFEKLERARLFAQELAVDGLRCFTKTRTGSLCCSSGYHLQHAAYTRPFVAQALGLGGDGRLLRFKAPRPFR